MQREILHVGGSLAPVDKDSQVLGLFEDVFSKFRGRIFPVSEPLPGVCADGIELVSNEDCPVMDWFYFLRLGDPGKVRGFLMRHGLLNRTGGLAKNRSELLITTGNEEGSFSTPLGNYSLREPDGAISTVLYSVVRLLDAPNRFVPVAPKVISRGFFVVKE